MAIIYRHIRLDTNEVFYIGIGVKEKRSRSKYGRNKYWKAIVDKHGYEIQVIKRNLSYNDACECERILIDWYGRKDLGKGNLVNLTNGGDTTEGYIFSQKTKNKIGLANIGRKHSLEINKKKGRIGSWNHLIGQSPWNKGKKMDESYSKNMRKPKSNSDNHFKKRIILNTETGVFYQGINEASKSINMNYSTLRTKLQGGVKNDTNLIYC